STPQCTGRSGRWYRCSFEPPWTGRPAIMPPSRSRCPSRVGYRDRRGPSITSEVMVALLIPRYHRGMVGTVRPVGDHLRAWRQRRRLSQLDLALEAEISPRHLSFLETGRSQPSRDMLLHLAERLDVPLRERNTMLLAAGYAPVFPERSLDDPAMRAA